MSSRLVQLIEDERDIARLIQYNLKLADFEVRIAESGEEGLTAIEKSPPDVILLDLMLPGIDGLEVCRQLKANQSTAKIPLIMVTAKGTEPDVVRGLEMGADDYVTKPFSPAVLVARVKASSRQVKDSASTQSQVFEFGNLRIHFGKFEVTLQGRRLELTRSEFQILSYLAQRPGWVFTRAQIIASMNGNNYSVTERTIDFQLVGLRKKLGAEGQFIETVRGVGYRFKEAL